MVAPSYDEIVKAPKALLHDHLDGGLRPATIVELAAAHRARAAGDTTPRALGAWFVAAADSGSLERYLETFAHTVGGHADAGGAASGGLRVRGRPGRRRRRLRRVAVRAGAAPGARSDAARGGRGGAGRLRGRLRRRRPSDGHQIRIGTPAHRDAARRPVDGDRRAGGALPGRRRGRLRHRRRRGRVTRPPGTWTRSSICSGRISTSPSTPARRSGCRASGRRSSGAVRTGSATACGSSTTSPATASSGRLAAYVRDKRIPLELCPSSNVQTGAAPSIAEHPIGLLQDLRFRVTVNTDNRLMSGTSMSREMCAAVRCVRLRLAGTAVVDGQRDEELVHTVRRAAAADQRRDQAGVRKIDRKLTVRASLGGSDRSR